MKVFAHRGASGQYAEHTRAAYLQALAEGADGVECDVHLSRDGELVLIHDSALDRTSNGTGRVEDHTLEQLRRLDFHSWKGAEIPADHGGPGAQLLTLSELLSILAEAARPVRLAVELKYPGPVGGELEAAVFRLLTAAGWRADDSMLGEISVSFMSFNPDAVLRLLDVVAPRFVCQLLENAPAGPSGDAAREAYRRGEELIADRRVGIAGPGVEYIRTHPSRVAGWADAGVRMRVWTVNTVDDVALCAGLGVREVTTDHPARTAELAAAAAEGGRAVDRS